MTVTAMRNTPAPVEYRFGVVATGGLWLGLGVTRISVLASGLLAAVALLAAGVALPIGLLPPVAAATVVMLPPTVDAADSRRTTPA